MKYLSFILIFIVFACNSKREPCNLRYIDINKKPYHIKGCLNDSLEDGKWYVHDTSNALLEYGYFNRGLREGPWHYLHQHDSVIIWKKLSSKIGIMTNLPDAFEKTEEGSYFAKFQPSNKEKLFSLVIAIHDLLKESLSADSFYKRGENEIYERGFNYNYIRHKL